MRCHSSRGPCALRFVAVCLLWPVHIVLAQAGAAATSAPASVDPASARVTPAVIHDASSRLEHDYQARADSASARAARLLDDINREGKWSRWTTTIGGLGAATFGFLARGDKGKGIVAGASGLLVGVGSVIEKAAGTSNKQSEADACRAVAAQWSAIATERARWETSSTDPAFQNAFAQAEAAFRGKVDAAMSNATCHYHFP